MNRYTTGTYGDPELTLDAAVNVTMELMASARVGWRE